MADLTGLYRAGPIHVLIVERDGDLEVHGLCGLSSTPPQRLSATAVDHHVQAGRWERIPLPLGARVVLALDEGAWPPLGTSLGEQDPLPCLRVTTTSIGWTARLTWAWAGLQGDGQVFAASSREALIAKLRGPLLSAGWLLVEVNRG